jgi:hypothetical protein
MRKRHLNGSPVWSDSIHKTQDCSINYPDFTDTLTELRTGSRRDRLPEIRAGIVRGLAENYGSQSPRWPAKWESRDAGATNILTRGSSSYSTAAYLASFHRRRS